MSDYILEMNHIRKEFLGGKIIANEDITLQVKTGEIHALCGENGAGKSVLMQILNGLYPPTKGDIIYKGKKVSIASPSAAADMGIGMVYQHFMLIETLSVAENMVLGFEPRKGVFFDLNTARKKVKDVSQKYGLNVDPDAKISNLSVGMQQRVEILKILFKGAELLVFDEPSAVLTPQEIKDLYIVMQNLIAEGKTIIFITHKLQEILDVSHNVTVIRRGRNVGTLSVQDADKEKIAKLMVGRPVLFQLHRPPVSLGEIAVEVNDIHAKGTRGNKAVDGISFTIQEGEILGIAGVEGNGQTELLEILAGLLKPVSGSYRIMHNNFDKKNVLYIREHGLSHIPEDRHKRAALDDYTIEENIILGCERVYTEAIFINYKKAEEAAKTYIQKYDVRPANGKALFGGLSGGNQQKAVIARELERNYKFIIVAQPTRGVDIGAIEMIHNTILNERTKKKAILLVSADLAEILALSDRILVMSSGRIAGILSKEEATPEKIGVLMAGGVHGPKN